MLAEINIIQSGARKGNEHRRPASGCLPLSDSEPRGPLVNFQRKELLILPTTDTLEEVPIVDLSGRLSRTTMQLTSTMDLKVDFKIYHSPPRDEFIDADAIHNDSAATRDIESSVVENSPGQPLYNAEIYGSLRKGGAVKFFSMDCVGLVAATFASTFSIECLNSVIQPMLSEHFGLKTAELAASKRLTSIPLAFCFFIGLLSDCYPILGFRRKGYLIIGLATTVLSFFALSGLDGYIETLEDGTAGTGLAVAIIAFATLASTGSVMTYVCVQTRVLELSQREPLGMRGAITGTYLIFRCVVYIFTDAITYMLLSSSGHHCTSLLVFGSVVALSIPLVWKAWQEKYYSLSTPMKTRGQILWRIMQQKAVWSILMFMCFFTLFSGIAFSGPSVIISVWAGASGDNSFALILNYGINALAFIGLYFLPRHKLDTQQLRSYGGYTKCASAAIVTFAVGMFLYSLIVTVLTLNPSTSCLSIAGGDGC
ncbi:Major facilitator superfamily domain [Phytophthora cactorum]|nr:Major facilitator superfamily domain [Phytophthora cactorum]